MGGLLCKEVLVKRELQVKKADSSFKINASEILGSKTRRPGIRDFSSLDIENVKKFIDAATVEQIKSRMCR
jgi:hypothetical protein